MSKLQSQFLCQQKGFIQIPILISIIIWSVFVIGGGYFGIKEYKQYQIKKFNELKSAEEKENQLKISSEEQQKVLDEAKLEIEKLKQEGEQSKQKQSALEQRVDKATAQLPVQDTPTKNLATSDIVSKNKRFIVSVMCDTSDGFVSGSGIIIGKNNAGEVIVITNYHVIEGASSKSNSSPCLISTSFVPPYYAQPIFFPSIASEQQMSSEDWALLLIKELIPSDNPLDNIFKDDDDIASQVNSFPKICSRNDLIAGVEIIALGYPAIGGGSFLGVATKELIATEGIISSLPESWQHYFVSSVKIDQGNSGGGAFLKTNGCLAGMPTFAITGKIESLARIINLPNLNKKLNGFFDNLQQ